MTGVEMNASGAKKPMFAAVLAVGALLGGCSGPFKAAPTDDSPLSERIQQMVDANRSYPGWSDFPAAPTDVPDDRFVAERVAALARTGQDASRAAAAIQWTRDDPATYADAVRRRMNAARMAPGTAQTAAEVEAFARALRERAEPPPPIDPRG